MFMSFNLNIATFSSHLNLVMTLFSCGFSYTVTKYGGEIWGKGENVLEEEKGERKEEQKL